MLDLTQFEGHTKGPWMADLRPGCCAIYQKAREHESNGLSLMQDRNIAYSTKGAVFSKDAQAWTMDGQIQKDFVLMASAPDLLAEIKANRERLQGLETYAKNMLELLDEARESVAFELGWYVEDEPRPRYKAHRERLKYLLEKIDKEIEGDGDGNAR